MRLRHDRCGGGRQRSSRDSRPSDQDTPAQGIEAGNEHETAARGAIDWGRVSNVKFVLLWTVRLRFEKDDADRRKIHAGRPSCWTTNSQH